MADSAAPLRNASYSYSDAGRLATAVGTWGSDTYTWDANDNRTRADRVLSGTTTSDVATLATGTNRLSELRDGAGVLSRSFAYTPAGDTSTVTRAGAPTLGYTYDARGRLINVTSTPAGGSASTIASYAYDWREQRVAASSAGAGAVHYLYAEDGQLLAEMDAATGTMLREYVWLDTMPLATITGPAATPTYQWITTGNLNEPLLLTNAAGQVTASTTRDPWGTQQSSALQLGAVPERSIKPKSLRRRMSCCGTTASRSEQSHCRQSADVSEWWELIAKSCQPKISRSPRHRSIATGILPCPRLAES